MSGHCEICGETGGHAAGCYSIQRPTPATGGEVVAWNMSDKPDRINRMGAFYANKRLADDHIESYVEDGLALYAVPLVLASALEAVRRERDAAKPAAEWMRRTAVRLAVADEGDSLLVLARGLTGWVDRARATFDEYQDRALAAEANNKALRARLEQVERGALVRACRVAVLALAHAAEASDVYQPAYQTMSDALDNIGAGHDD